MGGRAWPRMVGATALLVLATACSGARRADGPTATVRTEPETTTTTNPYAVPAVIDAAYVNRVLAGLDQAVGDVVRLVVRSRTLPPEAVDRLRALYTGDVLQLRIDSFQDELRAGLAAYQPNPGNKRTTASDLITAGATCIFARVARDYSAVTLTRDSTPAVQWVALRPRGADRTPDNFNPTPWMYTYDGSQQGGGPPTNPCAAR
jgi:hypothetical protein